MARASEARSSPRGLVALELAALAPLMAIFLLVAVQLAVLFAAQVRDVGEAAAMASRAVRSWDAEHAAQGLARPCLERIEEQVMRAGGQPRRVGAGPLAVTIAVAQEVRIVGEAICNPE